MHPKSSLLTSEDIDPVLCLRGAGADWLLLCDHAGSAVPKALGRLGLPDAAFARHIAVDIGAWAVTGAMAAALGAAAIGQAYSRLVIDCNRRPGTPSSIAPRSDGQDIPGNVGRPWAEARVAEIFAPYHRAIAACLDRRAPLICAMHSFTRTLGDERRAVDIGVIHGPDAALADRVLAALGDCGLRVGRNTPYRIDFAGDYTLPVHAEARGLPYVEIEICQDLIGEAAGQSRLAAIMSAALARAAQASRR